MATDIDALEASLGIPKGLYRKVLSRGEASGDTSVSPKGAIGQAQLMPGTAADMGVDPTNPDQNVIGGARYLAQMLKRYGGDVTKAVEAYNEGPGRVDKGIVYPETQAYLGRVLGGGKMDIGGTLGQALTQAQRPDPQADALFAKSQAASGRAAGELGEVATNEKGVRDQMGQLKTPDAPDAPKYPNAPKEEAGDPTRVLGQFLPIVAMLGGLASHNYSIAAIKAATGAMQSAHDKDYEQVKLHHDQWMDSMKQIKDEHDAQKDRFDEAIQKYSGDKTSLQAQFAADSALEQNTLARQALANGDLDSYIKYKNAYFQAAKQPLDLYTQAQAADLARKNYEENVKRDTYDMTHGVNALLDQADKKYRDDHGGQPMPVEQKAELMGQLNRSTSASGLRATMGEEDKMRTELVKKGSPGAAYQAMKENANKIADAAKNPEAYVSPAGTAIVSDTFTRAFNGGNAIRGFQAKMLGDDRALVNNVQSYLQRAENGGKFTPAEIKQMAEAVLRVEPELNSAWNDSLTEAQNLAKTRGLDPAAIVPFGLDETGGEPPPPAAPVKLGANPDAEYNALPSGAQFIGPDGHVRTKP